MALKSMLAGKGAGGMFDYLVQTNPQFKQFVEQNKGKSVEQIANDYGINLEDLRKLLR